MPWNQSLCRTEGKHDVLSTYSRDLGVLLKFQQVRQGSTPGESGSLGFLSNQRMRIGPHLTKIWGTQSSLRLQQLPWGSSRLVKVFLGTLCSSIKEVKAPLVFDGEHGIALTQCRLIGPHLAARGCLRLFLELRHETGVSSRVTAGMALQSSFLFSDIRTPV